MEHGLPRVDADEDGVLIWIKAVPGGSRDVIAGVVGDRLKVKVSAPAEGGKANSAIRAVVAKAIGCRLREVSIHTGRANPEKIIRIDATAAAGRSAEAIARLLCN